MRFVSSRTSSVWLFNSTLVATSVRATELLFGVVGSNMFTEHAISRPEHRPGANIIIHNYQSHSKISVVFRMEGRRESIMERAANKILLKNNDGLQPLFGGKID